MEKMRSEVMELKKSIEKSMADSDYEYLLDTLKVTLLFDCSQHIFIIVVVYKQILQRCQLTASVIKKTKIDATLADVKKTMSSVVRSSSVISSIREQVKGLLKEIKRISPHDKAPPSPANDDTVSTASSKHSADGSDNREHRQKIVELIVEALSIGCDESSDRSELIQVRLLASGIEHAINNIHPFGSNPKQYNAKARTLVFNIKKNEVRFTRSWLSENMCNLSSYYRS
jgi:hypothetical protein